MAYQLLDTNIRQTATNAAAVLAAAGLTEDDEGFVALRSAIFDDLKEFMDADNKQLRKEAEKSGGSSKSRSGGGSKSSGSKSDYLKDAKTAKLNFGKFEGLTMAEVYDLSAEESEEYGYVDNDGDGVAGREYIRWIANNKDKRNAWKRVRAQALLDSKKAASADDDEEE